MSVNIPGGSFPGGNFQGVVCWVGIFPGGIFLKPCYLCIWVYLILLIKVQFTFSRFKNSDAIETEIVKVLKWMGH